MATCDDIRETLFLGERLDDDASAHLSRCARCRQEAPVTRALRRRLASGVVPEPPSGLTARTLQAAGPLLTERARVARQPSGWQLARVVLVALLPLPAILVFDAYVVYAAHAVLSTLLPAALSAYVVFNYAALVVLLMTLTYGAVPLFAERQARLGREARSA